MAKAKKKVVKKEKKDNKEELQKRIWLIVNFALIMVFGVLIAIWSEVVGIAMVGQNSIVDPEAENVVFHLTTEIIKNANHVMNRSIAITVGLYGFCQLVNYAVYLFKKKRVLVALAVLELAALITGYFTNGSFDIFVVPFVSALIYLRVLDLDER